MCYNEIASARIVCKYKKEVGILLKKEFIGILADKAEVTKKDATAVVEAAVETISELLKNGDSLTFLGFGTFKIVDRAEREGRNPSTGDPITIPAAKVPTFRPSSKLKELVNQPKPKAKGKAKKKK